jgi:serine/threonine protein kinase
MAEIAIKKEDNGYTKHQANVFMHLKARYPNNISYIDYSVDNDEFYMNYEVKPEIHLYNNGLGDVIDSSHGEPEIYSVSEARDPSVIIGIMYKIFDIVIYIHENNFIHGDLQEHNIMWDKYKKEPILIDWERSEDISILDDHYKIALVAIDIHDLARAFNRFMGSVRELSHIKDMLIEIEGKLSYIKILETEIDDRRLDPSALKGLTMETLLTEPHNLKSLLISTMESHKVDTVISGGSYESFAKDYNRLCNMLGIKN